MLSEECDRWYIYHSQTCPLYFISCTNSNTSVPHSSIISHCLFLTLPILTQRQSYILVGSSWTSSHANYLRRPASSMSFISRWFVLHTSTRSTHIILNKPGGNSSSLWKEIGLSSVDAVIALPVLFLCLFSVGSVATSVDYVGTWANKILVSVDSVGNWATEVLISISISDPDGGSFSGHRTFPGNETSSCGNWLLSSSLCASSMLCPSVILNEQFGYFLVSSFSSRPFQKGKVQNPKSLYLAKGKLTWRLVPNCFIGLCVNTPMDNLASNWTRLWIVVFLPSI